MLLGFQSSLIMADLHRLYSLILARIFLCQVNSNHFLMCKNFSHNDHVFNGNLIKNIQTIFVVFMND